MFALLSIVFWSAGSYESASEFAVIAPFAVRSETFPPNFAKNDYAHHAAETLHEGKILKLC